MASQLITLVVVLSIVVGAIWLLRRAGDRSRERSARNLQERVVGKTTPERPPRERRRKRRPEPARRRPEDDDREQDQGDDQDQEAEDQAAAEPEAGDPQAGDAARHDRRSRRERKRDRKRGARGEAEHDDQDQAGADQAGADDETRAALRAGLTRTRGGFVAKLGKLFGKKKIDADVLPQLEEVLFTADIGPRAADRIFEAVKQGLTKDELTDPTKIWSKIRDTSRDILDVDAAPVDFTDHKPFVLLTIGVNGVGKTTTIGKLAARLRDDGASVLLAAGDTFRAAATEQLEVWGQRADVPVVKGKSGGDPSSVIFDAVKRGVDEGIDVVICDTAGRLHTKADLMDELKKVRRVCDKALPGAPHEVWLVLDATTGQNAITQAKTFKEAMEITGIVITKLDGSAKGGVILGICDELGVPVRFVGVGEKIADLRPFDAGAFVDALYEHADDHAAGAS